MFPKCRVLFRSRRSSTQLGTRDPSIVALSSRLVDALYFTVRVAKSVKHEIQKNSVVKYMINERFMKLAETV